VSIRKIKQTWINKGKELNGESPIETIILDIVNCIMIARYLFYNPTEPWEEFKSEIEIANNLSEAFLRLCGEIEEYEIQDETYGGENIDTDMFFIINCVTIHNCYLCLQHIISFCKHNNIDLESYCDKMCEK
jgi:hypothetical protein